MSPPCPLSPRQWWPLTLRFRPCLPRHAGESWGGQEEGDGCPWGCGVPCSPPLQGAPGDTPAPPWGDGQGQRWETLSPEPLAGGSGAVKLGRAVKGCQEGTPHWQPPTCGHPLPGNASPHPQQPPRAGTAQQVPHGCSGSCCGGCWWGCGSQHPALLTAGSGCRGCCGCWRSGCWCWGGQRCPRVLVCGCRGGGCLGAGGREVGAEGGGAAGGRVSAVRAAAVAADVGVFTVWVLMLRVRVRGAGDVGADRVGADGGYKPWVLTPVPWVQLGG